MTKAKGPASHESVHPLSGDPPGHPAAMTRATAAVEAELERRYPAAEGFVHTRVDESGLARKFGQVYREARLARRGTLAVRVCVLATSDGTVKLVTTQGAALADLVIYGLMGLGACGGGLLLISQRPDLPVGGLVFWSFVGLCAGGGVAMGLDRLLQPKVAPDMFSLLHADLDAIFARALSG